MKEDEMGEHVARIGKKRDLVAKPERKRDKLEDLSKDNSMEQRPS
jgi:hypothetical protein